MTCKSRPARNMVRGEKLFLSASSWPNAYLNAAACHGEGWRVGFEAKVTGAGNSGTIREALSDSHCLENGSTCKARGLHLLIPSRYTEVQSIELRRFVGVRSQFKKSERVASSRSDSDQPVY
eukprot:758780-Hanusia_phi.AAC.4